MYIYNYILQYNDIIVNYSFINLKCSHLLLCLVVVFIHYVTQKMSMYICSILYIVYDRHFCKWWHIIRIHENEIQAYNCSIHVKMKHWVTSWTVERCQGCLAFKLYNMHALCTLCINIPRFRSLILRSLGFTLPNQLWSWGMQTITLQDTGHAHLHHTHISEIGFESHPSVGGQILQYLHVSMQKYTWYILKY